MVRALTAGMITEITAPSVRLAFLVEMSFPSGPLNLWTGYGNLPSLLDILGASALRFDGQNDHVDFGDVLDLTGSFTLEARINIPDPGRSGQRIIVKDDEAAGWGLSVGDGGVDGLLRFFHRDMITVTTDSPSGTIVPNTTHRVSVVFDAGADTVTLYVDGTQEAQTTGQTAALTSNANSLSVGGAILGSDKWTAGIIDDVRIWNVVRTQPEIDTNKNLELGGSETGLVGYWKFNEAAGVLAADSSPSSFDGTLVGGPQWVGGPFVGAGQLLGFSGMRETTAGIATGVTITLAGEISSLIALALDEKYSLRPVTIWLAAFDASDAVIADPIIIFKGKADVMTIQSSGKMTRITLTCESDLIKLQRPNQRRYTNEDQLTEFPGDLGFEFLAGLQGRTVDWGIPDVKEPAAQFEAEVVTRTFEEDSDDESGGPGEVVTETGFFDEAGDWVQTDAEGTPLSQIGGDDED